MTCTCSPRGYCAVCIDSKLRGTPAYDRVTAVLDRVSSTGNLVTTTTGFGTTTTTRERTVTNTTTTGEKLASKASKDYLRNLLAERSGSAVDAIRDKLNTEKATGPLTQRLVSTSIDALKMLPRDERPATEPTAGGYVGKEGDVHYIGETYYRVAINKSGNWYLNRYVLAGFDAEGFAIGSWEYAKGQRRIASNATLATPEQAAAFGHTHKRCVFCTTKIERAESLNVGYGPDCADKYGLPWG